jgi:formate dehydrogenase maturation protein FdhE
MKMRNAMRILFVTKLLNRVHDKCALCEEIKRLEYLAIDDQDNMYDICEDCKKKGKETAKT